MASGKQNLTFSDLSIDAWSKIIRDIDRLKLIYEVGNNLVSFGTIMILRHLALRYVLDASRIIEVGSGPGTFLKKLLRFKNSLIIAIDASPNLIYYSSRRYSEINHILALAENIPIEDNSIDAIFCSFSFRDFFNKEKFFSEASRVLRPGGRLIIIDTNNSETITTKLFILYVMAVGRIYSKLLLKRRNLLIGLAGSIKKMKPVEFYVGKLYNAGFRKVVFKKFLLGNAFILIAVK